MKLAASKYPAGEYRIPYTLCGDSPKGKHTCGSLVIALRVNVRKGEAKYYAEALADYITIERMEDDESPDVVYDLMENDKIVDEFGSIQSGENRRIILNSLPSELEGRVVVEDNKLKILGGGEDYIWEQVNYTFCATVNGQEYCESSYFIFFTETYMVLGAQPQNDVGSITRDENVDSERIEIDILANDQVFRSSRQINENVESEGTGIVIPANDQDRRSSGQPIKATMKNSIPTLKVIPDVFQGKASLMNNGNLQIDPGKYPQGSYRFKYELCPKHTTDCEIANVKAEVKVNSAPTNPSTNPSTNPPTTSLIN